MPHNLGKMTQKKRKASDFDAFLIGMDIAFTLNVN